MAVGWLEGSLARIGIHRASDGRHVTAALLSGAVRAGRTAETGVVGGEFVAEVAGAASGANATVAVCWALLDLPATRTTVPWWA